MLRFSFKINHQGCAETELSLKYPKYFITVIDIQSKNSKEKQYFYYISGNQNQFNDIFTYLKKSKTYKLVKEIERSKDTLLLLVVLYQKGYIQNIIQKYRGFFLEPHTIYEGYEFWHVGVLDRTTIEKIRKEINKVGIVKVLYIGDVDSTLPLLSKQQKVVLSFALEQGYYEAPRKTNIAKMAQALRLNPATIGEHLMKAENKLLKSAVNKF